MSKGVVACESGNSIGGKATAAIIFHTESGSTPQTSTKIKIKQT